VPGAAKPAIARPTCRRSALAHLCIRYELRLRTTDADFARIAEHVPLERWMP
jgi:hypothetical protein